MTDLELVDRFQKGDEAAFNELVHRYKEKIYWTARRFLQDHDDADEVVQETFLKAYKGLRTFRSDSGVFTWLYRITVNTALNALRKRKAREFLGIDELAGERAPESDRPDEQFEQTEERALVEEAIRRLPEKQRAVFVLRFHDQLSYEEIAEILNTSVGGLKANFFHAMRKIGEYVKRAHGT